GLRRANPAAPALRALLVALPPDIVQHTHRAVAGRQQLQCVLQATTERRVGGGYGLRGRLVLILFALGTALALGDVTERAIDGKTIDPRAQLRVAAKLGEPTIDPNEDFLHDLFRIAGSDDACDEPVHPPLV